MAQTTRIVAHRGLRLEHPDNSLEGILAGSAVSDMVEIDVRRSQDGELVLGHDPEINGRTIAETPWPELALLDLGEGSGPVRLVDLLAVCATPLNLEVKNHPGEQGFEEDGQLGVDTARLARPGDLVTSFHWPTVDRVLAEFPDIETGLLLAQGSLDETIRYAVEQGHGTIVLHYFHVDPGTVSRVHEAGLRLSVYTLNDTDLAVALAAVGIDAIITDDPIGIGAALKENP